MLFGFVEEVGTSTDRHRHLGDELLADSIQRRVGDLCEVLLEVGEEVLGFVGKNGERRVVAHRALRLVRRHAHRTDEHAHVLLGVSEHHLAHGYCLKIDLRHVLWRVKIVESEALIGEPFAVWLVGSQLFGDFLGFDDALLFEIDKEHSARTESRTITNLVCWNIEYAGLGGHHEDVVGGHGVSEWAKSVSVEDGAEHVPIGKDDHRRAVPRLHHAAVILVEVLDVLRHRFMVVPCGGHHHRCRVVYGSTTHVYGFERVVE